MTLRRLAALAALWLVALAPPAAADAPPALTEADALSRAVAHNPTLRAALIELERAGLALRGEQHRYRPTIVVDGQFLHRATPSLRAGGIDTSTTDSLGLSGEITQSLPIGMQLGAQLAFGRTAQTYVNPTGAGSVELGPAYGLDLTLSVSQPLLRDLGRAAGLAALRTAEGRARRRELRRRAHGQRGGAGGAHGALGALVRRAGGGDSGRIPGGDAAAARGGGAPLGGRPVGAGGRAALSARAGRH
jgi:hypothetical protein